MHRAFHNYMMPAPRNYLYTAVLASLLVLSVGPNEAQAGPKSAEAAAFEESILDLAAPASATGDSKGKLGSSRMRTANQVASEMVKKRMRRDRGGDLKLLAKAGAADVVVVTGEYDRVQDVLKAMDVEHVVIRPRHVAQLELMATQTVMINCPGNIGKLGREKIESFVRRGGFLVTTDWALKTVVQKTFPKTIRHNGVETSDDVVKVQIHDHKQDELLAGLNLSKENPRWWLEGSSYPIKVIDKQKVKVLMSSKQMKKRYGQAPVVVSFKHDDGKVLHMTSHFYLQRSKKSKKRGSALATKSGLTAKDLDNMKGRGIDADSVSEGEVNSAYAMQQFSTNLLVSKKKQNKRLLKKYKGKTKRDVTLRTTKRGAKPKTMKRGFRVKVLERKGDEVRVEDLFGNEGWVPADAL